MADERRQVRKHAPLYAKIGARIRFYRLQKNVRCEDLARRLEIARPNISNIEAGRQNLYFHQVLQICDALEIKLSDLYPEGQIKDFERVKQEALNKLTAEEKLALGLSEKEAEAR